MHSIPFVQCFASAMTVTALLASLACNQTSPDQVNQHKAQRNRELDELSLQAGNPGLTPIRDLEPTGGHADSFHAYSIWLQSGDDK